MRETARSSRTSAPSKTTPLSHSSPAACAGVATEKAVPHASSASAAPRRTQLPRVVPVRARMAILPLGGYVPGRLCPTAAAIKPATSTGSRVIADS